MPAVSVVTVFHRDSPFLRPAIASILAQTFRDFEYVLVDNGTGMGPEVVGPMGADPRLGWVRVGPDIFQRQGEKLTLRLETRGNIEVLKLSLTP